MNKNSVVVSDKHCGEVATSKNKKAYINTAYIILSGNIA